MTLNRNPFCRGFEDGTQEGINLMTCTDFRPVATDHSLVIQFRGVSNSVRVVASILDQEN